MKILIKNGRVVDPANHLDGIFDILIEDSWIKKIAENIPIEPDKLIDAKDKIILPGLVDMHVHLREPGREDKETVASGTKAALKGGITSILAMPNTEPAIDSAENVRLLKEIIQKTSHCRVFICGAITKKRQGKELTDIFGLKSAGAIAISDDGNCVEDETLMLLALKKAKAAEILVISHCEDKSISQKGQVNFGLTSTRMGLRGIPKEAEYKIVRREINLAEKIDTPLHIAHVSCQESLEIIAEAKKKGLKITAEVTPHHFTLTEEAVLNYDTNMKVNPPLRSKEDVLAIKMALKNGIIDCIASDHAPHTENEKEIEFERAEFGTIGLETSLAVAITELVNPGILDWQELVKQMALNPARILGIDRGTLGIDKEADLIIVDPNKEWIVQKKDFLSQSKNSAFLGRRLKGKVEYTILAGKIVYAEDGNSKRNYLGNKR